MSKTSQDRDRQRLTCPFCSLLCDDLRAEQIADPARLSCPLARERYTKVLAETAGDAYVNGNPVGPRAAIEAASMLLRGASRPLFGGSSGDVAAMRALLGLAETTGGIVDHLHAPAMLRNLQILQSNGWMSANFGELKQRADLVVVLDSDLFARHPRLIERFIAPDASLHKGSHRPPQVITIGGPAMDLPDSIAAQHVDIELEHLGEMLNVLRCLLHERPLENSAIAPATIERLRPLLAAMREAHYGMVMWSAQSFDFEHADLTVHAAVELVAELNQHTRFACLPLLAGDGAATLQQVAAWKCGFPVRIGFDYGGPVYDPYHHDPARLLANGEADLLFWLSSFQDAAPPQCDLPTVVLGRPQSAHAEAVDVFIPVGTPAIDHHGYLFRGDGNAVIPAQGVRDIGLEDAATVLRAILHECTNMPKVVG